MTYVNMQNIEHIIIAGAGATGSYLTNFLTRNLKALDISNITVTVVDFDIVEEKNLNNQNFIAKDVGKNKAECIVKRYSIIYPNLYFYKDKIEKFLSDIKLDKAIITLCVDNWKTREAVYEICNNKNENGCIIVDTGVHEEGGQVLLYPVYPYIYSSEHIFLGTHKVIPWHIKIANKKKSNATCTNGILPIWNITAASIATNYIINVVKKTSIKYLAIFFGKEYKMYNVKEFLAMMKLFDQNKELENA
jgi:hypothetical protein